MTIEPISIQIKLALANYFSVKPVTSLAYRIGHGLFALHYALQCSVVAGVCACAESWSSCADRAGATPSRTQVQMHHRSHGADDLSLPQNLESAVASVQAELAGRMAAIEEREAALATREGFCGRLEAELSARGALLEAQAAAAAASAAGGPPPSDATAQASAAVRVLQALAADGGLPTEVRSCDAARQQQRATQAAQDQHQRQQQGVFKQQLDDGQGGRQLSDSPEARATGGGGSCAVADSDALRAIGRELQAAGVINSGRPGTSMSCYCLWGCGEHAVCDSAVGRQATQSSFAKGGKRRGFSSFCDRQWAAPGQWQGRLWWADRPAGFLAALTPLDHVTRHRRRQPQRQVGIALVVLLPVIVPRRGQKWLQQPSTYC